MFKVFGHENVGVLNVRSQDQSSRSSVFIIFNQFHSFLITSKPISSSHSEIDSLNQGGLKGWLAAGGAVHTTADPLPQPAPGNFRGSFDGSNIKAIDEVFAASQQSTATVRIKSSVAIKDDSLLDRLSVELTSMFKMSFIFSCLQ